MEKRCRLYIEIILKEEEKYQLVHIGAIPDLQTTIDNVIDMFQEEKNISRVDFIHYFYGRAIRFCDFIQTSKYSNIHLKNKLYQCVIRQLDKLKKEEPGLLDRDLRSGKITIAYHLSEAIYKEMYDQFCQTPEAFETPIAIKTYFKELLRHRYPLTIDAYIAFLKEEDSSFWSITCLYIRQIAEIVANCIMKHPDNINNKDIVKDCAWSDTYEVLKSKIKEKEALSFLSGTDFRNYIIKICNFRVLNLNKKYSSTEQYVDDIQYDAPECVNTIEASPVVNLKEVDIDIHNPYEVAYTVSIILLNPDHPLYTTLTKGLEDKISVLIGKVINGLSYNEIVEDLYGENMNPENFQRAVSKARKDYERVRKTLTERLISILKKE